MAEGDGNKETAKDGVKLAPGFGAVQIPVVIYFALQSKGQSEKMKGLIITSSVLFLLSAGCWGLANATY